MLTACPILHQDRFLVVVNKPAGVLSHPNTPKADPKTRTAFEGSYDFDQKCFHGSAGKVWLIHRLDQDTSGVLLAALDERTADLCRTAFSEEKVQKTYLALVQGTFSQKSGQWLDHLHTRSTARGVRTEVLKGRPPNAELHYEVVKQSQSSRLALLSLRLITGKTHQIRVQASVRQHPLAGDDVYGDFPMNRRLRHSLGLRRLALHAQRLQLKHPASGLQTSIEAPLPDDLSAALQLCDLHPQLSAPK